MGHRVSMVGVVSVTFGMILPPVQENNVAPAIPIAERVRNRRRDNRSCGTRSNSSRPRGSAGGES
jgi:hypothetical protein